MTVGLGPLAVRLGPLGVGLGPLAVGLGTLAIGLGPLAIGLGPLAIGLVPLAVWLGPGPISLPFICNQTKWEKALRVFRYRASLIIQIIIENNWLRARNDVSDKRIDIFFLCLFNEWQTERPSLDIIG